MGRGHGHSTGTRAAIYARISDDKRDDEAGVNRQREDCIALIAREGWQSVGEYIDNDISAFSGRIRPAYRKLCEDIKAGAIDVVIAWHPDRLHRSPRELEDWIDLTDAGGVVVHTVRAGRWDLTTPTGRQTARIVGAVARGESEHKSDRVRRAMASLAGQGKRHGRRRAYGYDGGSVVQPEADLIREAARRVLGGEALWSVVRDFNERGEPTLGGGPWRGQTLRTVLISARIAGWREHSGEFVAEGNWPAIVDRLTVERLRRSLADPSRRRGTSRRSYLLSGGLLRCVCGAAMVGRPRHRDGAREYFCMPRRYGGSGCGRTTVIAEPVEDEIVTQIRAVVGSGELAARLRAGEGEDAEHVWASVAALESDLAELASAHGRGEITYAEWMAAREPMTARLDAARRDLGRLREGEHVATIAAGVEAWDAAWAAAPISGRRAMLGTALASVTVGPAVPGRNRFDPDRLSVQWSA